MTDKDTRLILLKQWLTTVLGESFSLQTASADASFRRYFRIHYRNCCWIAMDAPPDKESCLTFTDIAKRLELASLHVPHVYHANLEEGFLLLSDLGTRCYLQVLNNNTAERLYQDALQALFKMQTTVTTNDLPLYDATLLQNEMLIFQDWFLQKQLGITLKSKQQAQLHETFALLQNNALQQPQTFVHRDYHSRNLMFTSNQNPGILDFQDALIGPITYDLVSLLRDCYIAWPEQQIEAWLNTYYQQLLQAGLINNNYPLFKQWFNWMGLQRHLKAIGIFSRLNQRDGKSHYLNDIPRTFAYVEYISAMYPELASFNLLLQHWDIKHRITGLNHA